MPKNREDWLNEAIEQVAPIFAEAGYRIPKKVRVACGFPSKNGLAGGTRTRIGEAWSSAASRDGSHEILISPLLDDLTTVVGTLVHELCHVVVGVEQGHRSPFIRCAASVGLTGKPTQMGLDPKTYQDRYARRLKPIGKYPHGRLNAYARTVVKQPTRLLKAQCPGCGYTFRITAKWANEGLPECPCCGEQIGLAD